MKILSQETDEKYSAIFNASRIPIIITSLSGLVNDINKAGQNIFGYTSQELIGQHITTIYDEVADYTTFTQTLNKNGFVENYNVILKNKYGKKLDFLLSTSIQCHNNSDNQYLISFFHDITEFKNLEAQFMQAQKMESIARLTSGIAHDFNNLLTVIIGYAEIMLADISPDNPNINWIQEIESTGIRAAKLIRQLLAFSRHQIIEPQVINLNTIILDMNKMLRRLIGEDIEIITTLEEELWSIMIDPSQIEQVLSNLVVNARDAMPNGGKLTIETSNVVLDENYALYHNSVTPGEYVLMAISDTGVGMNKEITSHIFEPFYTTKEKWKGTGLGLSTCYGIVKQNKGNIWIYSEPGYGTVVKIYFPSIHKKPSSSITDKKLLKIPKGTETILVVEDDNSILKMVTAILQKNGYKVYNAANGEEALNFIKNNNSLDIHLLFTDVILNRMNGKDLYKQVRILQPNIKVLYMSGYTDNTIVEHCILEDNTSFIQKPFTTMTLLHKIRMTIDM